MALVMEPRTVERFAELSGAGEFDLDGLRPVLRVVGGFLGRNTTPDPEPTVIPQSENDTFGPADPAIRDGEPVEGELEFVVRSPGRTAAVLLQDGRRAPLGDERSETSWVAAEGLMEFTIRASKPGGPVSFKVKTSDLEGIEVGTVWRVLRFLSMCGRGSEFSLGIPGGVRTWNRFPEVDALIDPEIEQLALQLRMLSRHAGQSISMPGEFGPKLRRHLQVAASLIAGAVVSARWADAELIVEPGTARHLSPGDDFMVEIHRPLEVELPGGLVVSVDRWARLRHARVEGRSEAVEGERVLLKPGRSDVVEYQQRSWTADVKDPGVVRAEVGTWVAMYDNQVLAGATDLATLAMTVERIGIRPEAVLRSGSSELPGMP